MKPSRSELPFASFLAYCPRGNTQEIRRARNFMLLLKENRVVRDETAAALVARRLRERAEPFTREFLGDDSALVPIPGAACFDAAISGRPSRSPRAFTRRALAAGLSPA